jgi:hypothetical protein
VCLHSLQSLAIALQIVEHKLYAYTQLQSRATATNIPKHITVCIHSLQWLVDVFNRGKAGEGTRDLVKGVLGGTAQSATKVTSAIENMVTSLSSGGGRHEERVRYMFNNLNLSLYLLRKCSVLWLIYLESVQFCGCFQLFFAVVFS